MDGTEKNTWADWRLIPDAPPMIPFPEENLNYLDIPGRVGGPLDLTGVPFGHKTYGRISGSWTFLREIDNRHSRVNLYEEMHRFFAGKIGRVTLEEDPEHYYVGRFNVGMPKSTRGPMQLTITFDLEPQRYIVSNGNVDTTFAPL